jgi:polyhydroxyalkanoate synthase
VTAANPGAEGNAMDARRTKYSTNLPPAAANDAAIRTRRPARRARIPRAAATPKHLPAKPARSAPPIAPAPPEPSFIRDSYASTAFADVVDRSVHAATARFTAGLSPMAMIGAYMDWAAHIAFAPGKQAQLAEKAFKKWMRLQNYASRRIFRRDGVEPCIVPLPQDRRFTGEAWQNPPFDYIYQAFLLQQQWWHNAMTGVRGVTKQNENMVSFATRQFLDVFSPSNSLFTNPEIMEHTRREGAANLVRGAQNLVEDWERALGGKPPPGAEQFEVGRNVAITPGKVVYRNRLIELIQYSPSTPSVHAEPILIIPAWIMKYYILDLSPSNSLVRYLTGRGHTVFMISWKNPGPEDRDLAMQDYRKLGSMAALDAVSAIVPGRKVHGVGYCLGGTLLAITAATMARDGDERFATLSFFAAQADFKEAGELTLFINESQLSFLEDMMWEQGFLDTKQMAGAFQILRSNDLVWSRLVHDYLMGERAPMTDLMAWNADATRMPYRMHTEYLRHLFLDNDLAEGRFKTDGKEVALTAIRAPLFAVGTEQDHVAPWHSVYKFHLLTDTEVTFLLTSGGHNAGIVSEPGHPHRHYRVATKQVQDNYVDPDTWAAQTPAVEGSWWPRWSEWIVAHSGARVAPPAMGAPKAGYAPVCEAPGTYVRVP